MIYIVNKHTHRATNNDIYIGRGSVLGNPFKIGSSNDRGTVIAKYKDYILREIAEANEKIIDEFSRIKEVARYNDVNLICFCAPKACHGDVIKDILEGNYQNEIETLIKQLHTESKWGQWEC